MTVFQIKNFYILEIFFFSCIFFSFSSLSAQKHLILAKKKQNLDKGKKETKKM